MRFVTRYFVCFSLQELAGMLAEPLQPLYSPKFFAGRPSAAAALEGSRKAGLNPGTAGGTREGDPAGTDPDTKTASGVAKTVALAQSLVGARQSGKVSRGPGAAAKKKVKPWLSQRRAVGSC